MSNTLNTPVEAIELEFPLRVSEYALRRGSGGGGSHRGGDGIVREIEALAEMDFSLLTERRRHAPRGGGRAAGPEPAGATSCEGGRRCRGGAAGQGSRPAAPGDALRIETPGGGGYGPPSP